MSTKMLVSRSSLTAIGAAIRSKNKSTDTYLPSEMGPAIEALEDPSVLTTKAITANGSYDAAADEADGYSLVTVNVPNTFTSEDEGKVVSSGALVAQTARESEITSNGTYDTTTNDEVTINVSGQSATLIQKTITQNGTYDPEDDNADGYSEVTVNVSGGGGGATVAATIATSVSGGYNGGAVITVKADGSTIFTATAPDTYNMNYDKTSGTATVKGCEVTVTVVPPQNSSGKLGITVSSESGDSLNYSVSPNGANTSYGYSFSESESLTLSAESGITTISRADWNALTTAEKQAYGLVGIIDYTTGFERGVLVNGADYSE